jgi:hypothetical protein
VAIPLRENVPIYSLKTAANAPKYGWKIRPLQVRRKKPQVIEIANT